MDVNRKPHRPGDLPGAVCRGAIDHHDLIQKGIALHQGLPGDGEDGTDGRLLVEGGQAQADGHPLGPFQGHQLLEVAELLRVEGVLREPFIDKNRDGELSRCPSRTGLPGKEGSSGFHQDQRLRCRLRQGSGQRAQRLGSVAARPGGGSHHDPVVVLERLQDGLGDLTVGDHLAGDAGELSGERAERRGDPSRLRGRVEQRHLAIPCLGQGQGHFQGQLGVGATPHRQQDPLPGGADGPSNQQEIAGGFLKHAGEGSAQHRSFRISIPGKEHQGNTVRLQEMQHLLPGRVGNADAGADAKGEFRVSGRQGHQALTKCPRGGRAVAEGNIRGKGNQA